MRGQTSSSYLKQSSCLNSSKVLVRFGPRTQIQIVTNDKKYKLVLHPMSYFPCFYYFTSPPPGIAEWEALLPSFHISSVGPLRRADADGLEPVPLSHLPLQNLLCLDPALPLLPVSVREGTRISTDISCCMCL